MKNVMSNLALLILWSIEGTLSLVGANTFNCRSWRFLSRCSKRRSGKRPGSIFRCDGVLERDRPNSVVTLLSDRCGSLQHSGRILCQQNPQIRFFWIFFPLRIRRKEYLIRLDRGLYWFPEHGVHLAYFLLAASFEYARHRGIREWRKCTPDCLLKWEPSLEWHLLV